MDGPPDPFRVLSLPYDAGPEDVRRAFRRLARQTHPDRGGSTEAFHRVRAAYDALAADLESARRRWRSPSAPPTSTPPSPGVLDRRVFPTCLVRFGRTRDGRRTVEYDLDSRPASWRPGTAPPPGGTCRLRVGATEAMPAFGVWEVPLDAHRFRCVFGPHPGP